MLLTSRQATAGRGGDIKGGADSEASAAVFAAGPGRFPDGQLQQEEKYEEGTGGAGGHRRPPRGSAPLPAPRPGPADAPPPPRSAVLTAGPSAVV